MVGPWEDGEFASLRDTLEPLRAWSAASTLGEAVEQLLGADLPPEVILLAEPRPGMNEQELVDRVQFLSPLTRLIVVAGSWCEGELRTGRPLAGALRLYWHELPAWWREATARRNAGFAPHWSAPLGQPHPIIPASCRQTSTSTSVAIDAADFAAFETLAAVLPQHGYDAVWTRLYGSDVRSAQLGIWDGGQLDCNELEALSYFCRKFQASPAPVLALVDYPRPKHFELIREAGAAAVLGKPYAVASLIATLADLTTPPPTASE
jgi:CheY-like chemotaxis protein